MLIESIIAAYLIICGVLPLAIGLRRRLSLRQLIIIAAIGLLFGWTGWGALLAWLNALTDDPNNDAVIRITS